MRAEGYSGGRGRGAVEKAFWGDGKKLVFAFFRLFFFFCTFFSRYCFALKAERGFVNRKTNRSLAPPPLSRADGVQACRKIQRAWKRLLRRRMMRAASKVELKRRGLYRAEAVRLRTSHDRLFSFSSLAQARHFSTVQPPPPSSHTVVSLVARNNAS